jgi:N-acetylglucosaminyl-diphospho-decaprenol L-rhamnosyltransferase
VTTPAVGAVPDVSIIVIAHDVREELHECFASIEQHAAAVRVEAILVDNASTDGTASAVAESHPWVQTVELSRNEGLPARNHGLRRARGRLRMFLDSDAKLTPGALPELVRFMDAHPDVGLVGPKLVYPDGQLQLSARRFPPPTLPLRRRPPFDRLFRNSRSVRRHLMADDALSAPREVEYVLGACQLFRREAQHAAGEIEPRFWFGPDDADWCFRIRGAGFRVAYDPDATVVHDYRRSSARRPLSKMALRHLAGFAYFQWKWRKERRRLLDEGNRMDLRGGALNPVRDLEAQHYTHRNVG